MPDQNVALALWRIAEKIDVIRSVTDSRLQHRDVIAALMEACWWIAALDEQLKDVRGKEYTDAKDATEDGYPIDGLRWARHRHSHDLIATGDGHVQPFFSDEPGVMFYISRGYRWRTVESMNLTGESATRSKDERVRYEAAVQGKEVVPILEGALRWLTLATSPESPPDEFSVPR
jgi:hypothetical protein